METGYRVPYLLQMIALHISTAKDQNSSGTVDMAEAFTHQCDQMSWGQNEIGQSPSTLGFP